MKEVEIPKEGKEVRWVEMLCEVIAEEMERWEMKGGVKEENERMA